MGPGCSLSRRRLLKQRHVWVNSSKICNWDYGCLIVVVTRLYSHACTLLKLGNVLPLTPTPHCSPSNKHPRAWQNLITSLFLKTVGISQWDHEHGYFWIPQCNIQDICAYLQNAWLTCPQTTALILILSLSIYVCVHMNKKSRLWCMEVKLYR